MTNGGNNPFDNYSITIEPYFDILNESVGEISKKVDFIIDTSTTIKNTTDSLDTVPNDLNRIKKILRKVFFGLNRISNNVEEISKQNIKDYDSFTDFLKSNSPLFVIMGVFGTISVFLDTFITNIVTRSIGSILSVTIFGIIGLLILLETKKIKDSKAEFITPMFIIKNVFIYCFLILICSIILYIYENSSSSIFTFKVVFGVLIITIGTIIFALMLGRIADIFSMFESIYLRLLAVVFIIYAFLFIAANYYTVYVIAMSNSNISISPIIIFFIEFFYKNFSTLSTIAIILILVLFLLDIFTNQNRYKIALSKILKSVSNMHIRNYAIYLLIGSIILFTSITITSRSFESQDNIVGSWKSNCSVGEISLSFANNNSFYIGLNNSSNNTYGTWDKIDNVKYELIVDNPELTKNMTIWLIDNNLSFNEDPSILITTNTTNTYKMYKT